MVAPIEQFNIERGLINNAVDLNMLRGVRFRLNEVHTTHLQFADDTIMFIKPRVEFLINLKRILCYFELGSGLRINFHKSCIVKVGKKRHTNINWVEVLRLLSSIPTYYMLVFKIPVGVAQKIKRMQHGFFWGHGNEKRKIHSVDWATVCQSKRKGSLGIARILDKNLGLLAKWVWRFGNEDASFWKKVLCAKYGMDSKELIWQWHRSAQASILVNTVSRLFDNGSKSASIPNYGIQVIWCGDKVRLWKDIMWDSIPLKIAFPRIFVLSRNKEGMLQEYGSWLGSKWVWDVPLRRSLFG
ncbi:hypothetical protein Dsin_012517 [Dipteronia sinensis]|uniref:Uncharacterized protein n=1 Tax=Dipteronia sinensis TaxID=43782 RepID=A0AAE0AJI3_9ROSI|nr:hypothetical protein Dsin_012517 [Dipteronia sinensis]